MSCGRPSGSLGGGGWQSRNQDPLPGETVVKKRERDQVLAAMFEMFIETYDPEIIESVVQSCNFNSDKAMDALLSMSSSSNNLRSEPSSSGPASKITIANPAFGLSAIQLAYGDTNNDDVIVESESEVEVTGKLPPSSASARMYAIPSPSASRSFSNRTSESPVPSSSASGSASALVHPSPTLLPYRMTALPSKPIDEKNYAHAVALENVQYHIDNGMKLLILMRGCPGSGKSYFAQQLIKSIGGDFSRHIFSTDDYFVRNGRYNFQPERLSDAHQWNQRRVLDILRSGRSPIIVDNTHTQMWEMNAYAIMAVTNSYAIEILEPQTSWFRNEAQLARRNSHGVPRDKIKAMLDRYEEGITVNRLISTAGLRYIKKPPQPAAEPVGLKITDMSSFSGRLRDNRASHSVLSFSRSGIQKMERGSLPLDHSALSAPYEGVTQSMQAHVPDSVTMSALHQGDSVAVNNDQNYCNSFHTTEKIGKFSSFTVCKEQKENSSGLSSSSENKIAIYSASETSRDVKHLREDASIEVMLQDPSAEGSISAETIQGNDEAYSVFDTDAEPYDNNLETDKVQEHQQEPKCDLESTKNSGTTEESIEVLSEETRSDNSREGIEVLSLTSRNIDNDSVDLLCEGVKALGNGDVNADTSSPVENNSALHGSSFTSDSDQDAKSSYILLPNNESPGEDGPAERKVFSCGDIENSQGAVDNSEKNIKEDSLCNSDSWVISDHWQVKEESERSQGAKILSTPLPARHFKEQRGSQAETPSSSNFKSLQELPQEETSWTICEGDTVSWQTIDKNQEEFYGKTSTSTPQNLDQRAKFSFNKESSPCDVGTNTHHSDFHVLNNPSLCLGDSGVKILDAFDRDINEGKTLVQTKITLKLMLDKGTVIDGDLVGKVNIECTSEKLKELVRLFPNISVASLKELLVNCQGDVNWASNCLLDTDGDVLGATLSEVADNRAEFDFIDTSNDCELEPLSETTVQPALSPPVETNQSTLPKDNKEAAEELKKHLEKSFVLSDECYSPHLRTIRDFRKSLREGPVPRTDAMEESLLAQLEATTTVQAPLESGRSSRESSVVQTKSDEGSEGSEEDEDEFLEFVFGQDLIQQLFDKFGGKDFWQTGMAPVVKLPVGLARQIHYYLVMSQEDQEDSEDAAVRLQCQEDEKMALQLYEEWQHKRKPSEPTVPQLQEIMDMEMAKAIYQADIDALQKNSQETVATVLAKRLLQDNFPQMDGNVIQNMLQAHNNSFEETFKVLQQSLSDDRKAFSVEGRAERERELVDKAKRESLQVWTQSTPAGVGAIDEQVEDPKEAMADAEAYRTEAANLQEERSECYRKAKDAFQRKERSVAAYYSQLANLLQKKIDQANARAATALVTANAHSHNPHTLDLHYLRVAEALQVFDMFLDHHIARLSGSGSSSRTSLFIITGRGARSADGKSRIKPAVMRRIKDRNLEFVVVNPGLLKVNVTKHSPLSC